MWPFYDIFKRHATNPGKHGPKTKPYKWFARFRFNRKFLGQIFETRPNRPVYEFCSVYFCMFRGYRIYFSIFFLWHIIFWIFGSTLKVSNVLYTAGMFIIFFFFKDRKQNRTTYRIVYLLNVWVFWWRVWRCFRKYNSIFNQQFWDFSAANFRRDNVL